MRYKKRALAQVAFVKDILKEKGMSDETIAAKMGRTRQGISKMISGTNIPRLDTFLQLCEVAGVELKDLPWG